MNEEGVIDNHPNPYHGNYDLADNGDLLSSDATWYPCPFYNPSPSRDEFLDGFASWNGNELAEETYEGEEFPYYSCGNWLGEYENSFSRCWGDGYFSHGNGVYDNEGDSELKEMDQSRQSAEEQQNESHLMEEVTEEYRPTCDSNPWYDLWLACGGKTEAHVCRGQETRHPHSYDLLELGVCESLFGYWPCLYR